MWYGCFLRLTLHTNSVVNSPSNIQSIPFDGHLSSPSKIFIIFSLSIQEIFFK